MYFDIWPPCLLKEFVDCRILPNEDGDEDENEGDDGDLAKVEPEFGKFGKDWSRLPLKLF
jgi:hypothetical protein